MRKIHSLRLHALVFALLAALPARAQDDRPVIEIAPTRHQAYRVAVQRFVDAATPPNSRRSPELKSAIADGLRFSGVLVPIADEAFLGPLDSGELADDRYDCGDWTQSGADALVEGRIASEAGELVVEFSVWDTARCKLLKRTTERRVATQGPRLARIIADRIVEAFTGTPGSAATEIAFISNRTGMKEVFVMNADGGNPRAATRSRTIKAFPDWLPDGGGILYTSYHDESQPALYITARRAGVRPGEILRGLLPQAPKYRGVFDPEGEELALVTSIDDSAEIFVVRRDGRKLRRLTNSPAIDISPSWSPDGERLVFVSDRSGGPQLYITNRDGSGTRRLTFQGGYNTAPRWSPDGRWIAYETRLEAQFDIWLIDPEGETTIPLVQHRRSDETPSWSPDGRKLAFASNRRGRYDIYVMDLASKVVDRLTEQVGVNTYPVWGPFPE